MKEMILELNTSLGHISDAIRCTYAAVEHIAQPTRKKNLQAISDRLEHLDLSKEQEERLESTDKSGREKRRCFTDFLVLDP